MFVNKNLFQSALIECKTDRDCNSKENGPNRCIKLSSLKDKAIGSVSDAESLIRLFQYLVNKDASVFLKYNQIIQALLVPNDELLDILAKYRLTLRDFYEMGICLCEVDTKGFQCKTANPNDKPFQCDVNSKVRCNPLTGTCQPSGFLLRNRLQKPTDKVNEYRSYFCECSDGGIVGINCEFSRNQCAFRRELLK